MGAEGHTLTDISVILCLMFANSRDHHPIQINDRLTNAATHMDEQLWIQTVFIQGHLTVPVCMYSNCSEVYTAVASVGLSVICTGCGRHVR